MKHFPVRWEGNEFSFGFGKFQTVSELLEHFESKPVIGGESGMQYVLHNYVCTCSKQWDCILVFLCECHIIVGTFERDL